MATYENVDDVSDSGHNFIRCAANTHNASMAVSNEIYGALILEPTIPLSIKPQYDDIDDFWLEFAKGQTINKTSSEFAKKSVKNCKHVSFDLSLIRQQFPLPNFPKPKPMPKTKSHFSCKIINFWSQILPPLFLKCHTCPIV